jgi:tetratricopeptide (TPR) repeat protein
LVHFDLAELALRHRRDPPRAAAHYRDYLRLLPAGEAGELRAYLELSRLAQDQDPAEAVALLESAARAGHRGAELERRAGESLARAGRYQEALERLQRYLDLAQDRREKDEVRELIHREIIPRLLDPPPKKD